MTYHIDYPEDCAVLQQALSAIGVKVTLEEADRFWTWRSNEWQASWLAFLDSSAVAEVKHWWPIYRDSLRSDASQNATPLPDPLLTHHRRKAEGR